MRNRGRWVRINDYSERVDYRPIQGNCVIKEININTGRDNNFIDIFASPIVSILKNVNRIFVECFPEQSAYQRENPVGTLLTSDLPFNRKTFNRLKVFFKKLNEQYKPEWFTDELTQELENILQRKQDQQIRHVIPDISVFTSHANYQTCKLIALLKKTNKFNFIFSKNEMKEIRELLAQGADPNEYDANGKSAFLYVACVPDCNKRLLELLTNYGDPRLPVGYALHVIDRESYYSAIEYAIYAGVNDNANIFLSKFSAPQKTLTTRSATTVTNLIVTSENKDSVLTQYDLSNKLSLFSRIKKLESVTHNEKSKLYPLYEKHLVSPKNSKDTVRADFAETFLTQREKIKNTTEFCEILFLRDEKTAAENYIGFRYFTVFTSKATPTTPYRTICDLTIIDTDFQSLGLALYISAIPAISLQLFNDQGRLKWSALNYKSAPKTIHYYFPKIKPVKGEFQENLAEFICNKYPDAAYYNDETMTTFIEEPYGTHIKTPNTLEGRFFENELKGNIDIPCRSKDEVRGVPVNIPLGDEFLVVIANIAEMLGINCISHVCEFGVRFAKLFDELSDKEPDFTVFKRYPLSKHCMFPDPKKPATVNYLAPPQTQRSEEIVRRSCI